MKDVVERVRELAGRVAATYGLEIFDVQFRREAGGMVVRVQIDRPGPAATADESVGVDECASISRDLSAVLDVEDVVPTAYTLEVSSPGLDRPLKRLEDYERFAGSKVSVRLRLPRDGRRRFEGVLQGIEEGGVVLEVEGERLRFALAEIDRARLVPEI